MNGGTNKENIEHQPSWNADEGGSCIIHHSSSDCSDFLQNEEPLYDVSESGTRIAYSQHSTSTCRKRQSKVERQQNAGSRDHEEFKRKIRLF